MENNKKILKTLISITAVGLIIAGIYNKIKHKIEKHPKTTEELENFDDTMTQEMFDTDAYI